MKNLSFPGLPRVLIVDDEDGVREGLRSMLQREGLHVETAGTAEEGARRVEAKSFDIVFLDLNLPGADGLSMLGTGLLAAMLSYLLPWWACVPVAVGLYTGAECALNTMCPAQKPGRDPGGPDRADDT